MKKLFAILMMVSSLAFAEATFDQIEGLIQQQNYSAAAAGLEVIIQNHPKSAKAFYAMAQAQAGLGNLEKAQKALNIATGLNPTLDFAPASSVASLKQAITPQVKKIEVIEESHALRNFAYFALFAGFSVACYFLYSVYARKRDEEELADSEKKAQWAKEMDEAQARHDKFKADRKAEMAASYVSSTSPKPAYRGTPRTVSPAPYTPPATPAPTTTVVNNSSNDMLTGVLIGNMISNSGHHHDSERVVTREVVRETPSRDISWDDTPSKPSRSSSWDDDSSSSSKSSSSWSSSSDSSSSSSWDSSSSDSSSSSSSSSWD